MYGVVYEAGTLLFPRDSITTTNSFPLASSEIQAPIEQMQILQQTLKKENIQLKQLANDEHTFVARQRNIFFLPEKLTMNISDDELNKNKKKVILSFTLPKGSYATIIIKGLFER